MKRLACAIIIFILLSSVHICAFADLSSVNGRLRYYDKLGREAEHSGVDVSYYNNQIDWNALKAQGFDFAIVRLGGRGWATGRIYGDRMTQQFLKGAEDAGLQVGAYFYSTARNPAEALEEAQAALYELNGVSLGMPVFIDMELSGDYPDGRSDSLSPSVRAQVADVFCSAIRSAGYQTGLYASEGYCRYNLEFEAVTRFPLWLASYTVDNDLPYYISNYQIWQQTDSASAGGIDGKFDLNIILP